VNRKQAAGEAAAALARDGMLVGLGTGSTAAYAIEALGARVRGGLRITGVATSEATAHQAREFGIPLAALPADRQLDLTIDGADEIERATLNLIKGRGGALLREKIVAAASARLVIIADESKLVERLGGTAPVPVEVVKFGWEAARRALRDLGAAPLLRPGPFVTDEGHYILDCAFGPIASPADLARRIDSISGVVEHGLFIGMADLVLIGGENGVWEIHS
jgi:ribose 5-phosphate isomerase A